MKYIVFVKVVKGELSPFDEAALETALRLRDERGGEVYVVTMAPESAADRMKALTRLGVERSILLSDPAFAGSDTAATSYILSLAAAKIGVDDGTLILCGRQSMDGDTAQVGASLTARLGCGLAANVMAVDSFDGRSLACTTRTGAVNRTLPALLTVERIAKLRFAPMRARAYEIERWDAKALGADIRRCGLKGSPTRVLRSFESERGRRQCTFLTPKEMLAKLYELKDTPRSHIVSEISDKKLREVWAVGEDVSEIASRIADEVVTLPRMEAADYVKLFREKRPETVLFPADLWGRCVAPQVATALETGLCADCTLLETDGEKLFMYRPAFGGNVTAKIECRTRPQMATVRTVTDSSDVILSCGLGVKNQLDALRPLAEALGAEMGASRGLVDAGLAPYEWQVGITGRTVAPKLYVAAGISGAVHHTAAVEGSEYIVGINPDRGAPIFDYCDFGCICRIEELLEHF
ncbi:MAG: FAD-binding protein [Clostridia bacterium]|nr:FAD-binding protein [Clostridia bacterium]